LKTRKRDLLELEQAYLMEEIENNKAL